MLCRWSRVPNPERLAVAFPASWAIRKCSKRISLRQRVEENADKRKLEQGPVGHEVDFKCKVYENGQVVAGPETLRQLASFSERQIRKGTGVDRDTIRAMRHGKGVKRSTYEKVMNLLREKSCTAVQ